MPKTLRFYQRDAHKAVRRAWMEHRSVLVHSGTGSGKSVMACSLIEEALKNGKRCLYCADSDDLVFSPLKSISQYCNEIPGLEKSKYKASLNEKVVVASMQTLGRKGRLERFPRDHFDYVLIDESHRAAKKKKEIADYFDKAFVCGFTATPWRKGLRDLSKYYDTVAISISMMNLIEMGFAPPISVLSLPVEVDLNCVRQSMSGDGKDFNAEDMDTTIAPYYQKVAELIKEYAWDRKIVAFLPLIKSSEAFAAILRNNHIKAVHIDGTSTDRALIYRKLAEGEIDVITNASVMSTGVDIPEADCLLNLSATRSSGLYQQRVGRICRAWPGCIDDLPEKDQVEQRKSRIARSPKPDTLVLDLLWTHDTLSSVRPGDMFATSPEEAKRIFERSKDSRTPLELLELAKEVQREKELALVEHLKQAADKHRGRDMRAEHVGVYLNDTRLMEYEPVAKWEMKKASPEQMAMLERCGVEMTTVISRGQASEIISRCIKRRKDGLATLKQVRIMHQKGVENAEKIKFEDASKILDELLKKPVDDNKLRADDVLMSNSKKNSFADRGFTRNEKGHIVKA